MQFINMCIPHPVYSNLMTNNLPALAGQIPYLSGQLQGQRVAVINSFDIQSLTVTNDANLGLLKTQVETYQHYQQISQPFKNALHHEIRCRQIKEMDQIELAALKIAQTKALITEIDVIKQIYKFHHLDARRRILQGILERLIIMKRNKCFCFQFVKFNWKKIQSCRSQFGQIEKQKPKSNILEPQEQQMKLFSTTCIKQQNYCKQWKKNE